MTFSKSQPQWLIRECGVAEEKTAPPSQKCPDVEVRTHTAKNLNHSFNPLCPSWAHHPKPATWVVPILSRSAQSRLRDKWFLCVKPPPSLTISLSGTCLSDWLCVMALQLRVLWRHRVGRVIELWHRRVVRVNTARVMTSQSCGSYRVVTPKSCES